MKAILPILLVCISTVNAQSVIHPNQVNLATLLIDYDTEVFESGNMQYFDCASCSNDTLPFVVHYNPPLDFGNITYNLSNGDTFFSAGIIWMGMGSIQQPTDFTNAPPFDHSDMIVLPNNQITYYDMEGNITTDASFIADAYQVVGYLGDLNVCHDFFLENYQIGVYLYAPTVGMFDPAVAKWVIFLYYNGGSTELPEPDASTLIVYPNPVNEELVVSNGSDSSPLNYELLSLDGKILQTGKIENQRIAFTEFASGMYLLKVYDQQEKIIQTKKIIKK